MQRYYAFLRAINVGGHTVKMDALRLLFERMGFSKVETFIASGNVIFETAESQAAELEARIENGLRTGLGYEAATFLRTDAELAQVAAARPFSTAELEKAAALNVAFLKKPLEDGAARKLAGLRTEIDDFRVLGREMYWLCHKKQSESTFSNAVLEKTLKVQSTLRGMETVRKLSAKYLADES